MSIQTIDGSDWERSTARAALRRVALVVAIALVIAGPLLVGGAVGWMMTREAGPVLGNDGWLRSRSGVASAGTGFPLVSASELEAAGITVDEARRILRR